MCDMVVKFDINHLSHTGCPLGVFLNNMIPLFHCGVECLAIGFKDGGRAKTEATGMIANTITASNQTILTSYNNIMRPKQKTPQK